MSLSVEIHKKFKGFSLDAAFEAADETLALLGPSGCGKSLTLGCIAGTVTPDHGRIVMDGVTLFDSGKKIDLPPQMRRVGVLFQHYALFPHMTVTQNLLAALRRNGGSPREAEDMLARFGLERVAGLYPAQLSGGQKQRTALARMLLSKPGTILLDEPLSALDSHLKFHMERELMEIAAGFGKTAILVSHDQDEVFRLSDRVAVMIDGRIVAQDTRDGLFRTPRTRNAAVLTGCKNISRAAVLSDARVAALDWGISLGVPRCDRDIAYVGVRMRDIVPGDGGENCFSCRVAQEIENPFSYTVMLSPVDAAEGGAPLGWELGKDLWLRLRAPRVTVSLAPQSILLLKE